MKDEPYAAFIPEGNEEEEEDDDDGEYGLSES